MKRVTILMVLAAMVFGATACGKDSSKNNDVVGASQDLYGMGAVTAVKLLGSEFSGEALSRLSAVKVMRTSDGSSSAEGSTGATSDSEEVVKSQAEEIHQYMRMLDGFFGDDVVKTEVSANVDVAYAYDYKLTITGKDVYGEDVVHIMYYTEKLLREEIEVDDDDWFEEAEEEIERSYALEGVLVMDGVNYPMRGERSEEVENDESEAEIKIRAYLNENDFNTFVQVEQELSQERNETEREYVYSVYQSGKLVEKTSVEFETERKNDKEKAEYEVEFLSGNGRGRYEVKRKIDQKGVFLHVNYSIDGKKGNFVIREEKGANGEVNYVYSFSDGAEKIFGKVSGNVNQASA